VLRLYNALFPAARRLLPLAAGWNSKIGRGLEGRRGVVERLEALAPVLGERVILMHSTSVGEYEQARPLVAELTRARPDLAILHTFFSPSGFDYAERLGEARYREYLPFDTPSDVGRVLDALGPRLLVFVKFDLWPNWVVEADRRGIPVALVDATLHPRSRRSRWPARALYTDLYRRLACISAVDPDDAARFRALAPRHPNLVVDGDTRFDQVWRRRNNATRVPIAPVLQQAQRPFTLLAGSTWPADEALVLGAWHTWRARVALGARLLLVPHEPTPSHLQALEHRLALANLRSVRLSSLERLDAIDAVVVDKVGMLAELYACADAAYVGGAWGRGVHNILEPAIMRLPLFFGPRHHNAPEAEKLLETGAAAVIRSPHDLVQQLERLGDNAAERLHRGSQARAFVEANLGASERCAQRLLALLAAASTHTRETR
jgi:3-deoxy-D-manno-octulosonic-acid transferase